MHKKIVGREAVKQAVIEAACDLFSEKAPGRVSIREIADKAGVNHGLIHRHFGSKRNLILQVLLYIDGRMREATGGGETFNEVFRLASEAAFTDSRYWRIPANLIMDGEADLLLESRISFLQDLKEMAVRDFDKTGFKGFPAEESIFLLIALGLGTEMFGEYICRSMRIEQPDIKTILQRVLLMVPGKE